MMVNCPKCGFDQPEDKYCASCGVDMDRYQPQKSPLILRVVKSWVFQLVTLVIIVALSALFIRSQRSDRAFDVEVPKGMKQQYTSNENPVNETPEIEEDASGVSEQAQNLAPVTPTPTPSETPLANSQRQIQFYFQFGEIGLDSLASIRNQGKDEFQGMDSIIGVLGNQSEILGSGQLNLRASSPMKPVSAGNEVRFFLGSQAEQAEFREGLRIQITTSLIRESSSLLQIRLLRGFRFSQDPETETEFVTVAEWEAQLPHKGAIYILGIIPRDVLEGEEERSELGNPVFDEILSSPEFRSGESEFIFMVRSSLTDPR